MTESVRGLEFLAWLEQNRKQLVVGVLVVALLASGFAIYRWRSAQLQIEANSALALIQSRPVAAGEAAEGPGSEEYLEFASRYRGTAAGKRGLLLAAGALFREGKYAESLEQFEAFRAGNVADPLAGTGALGVASCLEAMGKNDEAIAAHRDVIATYPESAAATESRLALGGLLELKGEAQEAFNLYEQLQTTAFANEAQTRRQTLLASHPELATTNAAMPELSTPAVTSAAVTNAAVTNAAVTNAAVTNAAVTNAAVTVAEPEND